MNFTTFFISYLRLKKEGHYVEELYVRRISFSLYVYLCFISLISLRGGKLLLGKCKDVRNYYCMFASRVRVSGTSLSFLFVIARKSLRASTSFEYLRALSYLWCRRTILVFLIMLYGPEGSHTFLCLLWTSIWRGVDVIGFYESLLDSISLSFFHVLWQLRFSIKEVLPP